MKNKKYGASVLAVTMIIMGIILVTALSVSLVSVKERKASIGGGRSGVAFQNAQTGVEKAMNVIVYNQDVALSALGGSGLNCSDGSGIATLKDPSDSSFTIQLKKVDDSLITSCADLVSLATTIKSIGQDKGTQNSRAIEAAVAAGLLNWKDATLKGTWSNFGAPHHKAGFTKDNQGVVHLRGVVAPGGSCGDNCIFNLDDGFKPTKQIIVPAIRSGMSISGSTFMGVVRLDISTSGCVNYTNDIASSVPTWISLDSITFPIN